MQTLIYDGVSFDVAWMARIGEEDFVNHPCHANHYVNLSEEDKKKKLRDIYGLIASPAGKKRKSRQGK